MSILTTEDRNALLVKIQTLDRREIVRVIDREANAAWRRGYEHAFADLKADPHPLVTIANYGRKDEPVTR